VRTSNQVITGDQWPGGNCSVFGRIAVDKIG